MELHGESRQLEVSEFSCQIKLLQHYEVHRMMEDGDQVAVQLTWTATLATAVGAMASGSRLVAHVAAFYEFRDDLILRQSSYDCYEPLPVPESG